MRAVPMILIFAAAVSLSFRFMSDIVKDKIILSDIRSMAELALHDENSIRSSIELRFDSPESLSRKIGERTHRQKTRPPSSNPSPPRFRTPTGP